MKLTRRQLRKLIEAFLKGDDQLEEPVKIRAGMATGQVQRQARKLKKERAANQSQTVKR